MMETKLAEIIYDIHLLPGELLRLPDDAAQILGPGHWQVCIRPKNTDTSIRDHAAFLNSYGPDDEGLYDDYSAR
jgi:hypothetical protein